jgi:hypothetical protein
LRPAGALYGLILLLAASASPHRHLNSFEDLVSDRPSDSGFFLDGQRMTERGESQIGPASLIDDEPCLACFHHDYAASAVSLFVFGETFVALPGIPPRPHLAYPDPVPDFAASRSPPNGA